MKVQRATRTVPVVVAKASLQSGADHDTNSRAAAEADRLARYRLVIEEGSRKGSFVYKILDWETGEVVRQLPSEEVLEMRQRDDYGVGSIINAIV